MKTKQKSKGFGAIAPKVEYRSFFADLNRRFRDDSELFLGHLVIRVPRWKNSKVEYAIARAACCFVLFSEEAQERKVNQAFLYTGTPEDAGDQIDRFDLRDYEGCHTFQITPEHEELFKLAREQCQTSFRWRDIKLS